MSYRNTYEVLEDRWIEDVRSRAMILRHKKTGARVAVLSNDDDNKVFYIGFRTTPEDDTGVPHIIEHTTLCGSDKYPVKDPFIELAKGSLNTFLNAMTYPDKTVYPLASYNTQDFNNLMDVYMDAVFHPNITRYEEIFKQEGWHYELESEEGEITVNGVVYNEMKGAYSSPDEVLQSAVYRSLFPDNTYSKDSGGNPLHIPELTYQAYLDFYHKYYHPSNSYIYLYGDMDVEERLDYIDREYLSEYGTLFVDSAVKTQKSFEEPVEYRCEYAVSPDDPVDNACYLSYNRVVGNSLDPMLYHAFKILEYALASAPGAPVREALINAGIGEDVYGEYEGGVKQPVFSVVAKNANEADKDRFESIIREVLIKQAEEGMNQETLLAAINSEEFRFREADFGQFPKGLLFGLQCLDTWIFDDMAPFVQLECLNTYAKLRENIGTGYFEGLIREYLLDNPHGSLVMVVPKPGKNEEEEAALAEKMSRLKAGMTEEEIRQMVKDTQALIEYQETPSPDEDLEKIPLLDRKDLRREAMQFSNIETEINGIPTLHHDVESNGIAYFSLLFDAEDIPVEDLGYLGFLSTIDGLVNTENYSYMDLANTVDIYTGGITEGTRIYSDVDNRQKLSMKYEVSVKVLSENLEKACDLTQEILLGSDYSDLKRLSDLVAQTKARMQERLSSGGHSTAMTRCMSYFSRDAYYQDKIHGIDYYRTVCEAEKLLEKDPRALVDKLTSLRDRLFARSRMLISFTGDEALYRAAKGTLARLTEAFPAQSSMGKIPEVKLERKNEAFTDGSQIQYVAIGGNFTDAGYTYTGKLRLLRQILSLDYLWNNVRVKGGAYGVMTNYMRNGDSYFVSYRDPKLRKTVQAYQKIAEYIRDFNPDERDMTKYIIGTFGSIDTPMNPEAKGRRSLRAYFEHVTYKMVQTERDAILNAEASDIRALEGLIKSVLENGALCVIGNESKIRAAEGMFGSISKLSR